MVDNETFSGDLFAEKAVNLIEAHNPQTPMLLHYHLTAPHTPLQAAQSYLDLCSNVSPGPPEAYQTYYRQYICAMVLSVDLNILQVLLALVAKDMLSSTLVLFHSDNGGYMQAGSINTPFRGQKGTNFEGGIHVPAFVYGNALLLPSYVRGIHRKDLFHVSDVLPTLLGYLGVEDSELARYDFDGVNHWKNLVEHKPLTRNEIAVDISSSYMAYSSAFIRIIQGETWKYIFNPSVITFLFIRRSPMEGYEYEGEYLFNLSEDPSEVNNLIPSIDQSTSPQSGRTRLILELLRREVIRNREKSTLTLLSDMPPVYDVPPSPLGCWLPVDSPIFSSFDCDIKPNFDLPKLPPGAKFLSGFDDVPNATTITQVVDAESS